MNKKALLIKHCHLLDHRKQNPFDILIFNNTINKISNNINKNKLDKEYGEIKIIDGKDKFISPGLIDSHVHLILNGSSDIISYVTQSTIEEFTQSAQEHAITCLKNGITSIRDMGDVDYIVAQLKKEINKTERIGPRIISSGHMITAKKGHVRSISRKVKDSNDVKKAIEEQIEGGADFIKLIVSGGLLSPDQHPLDTELTKDMIAIVLGEVKKMGMKCAVHAYSDKDINNCIKHDVWSIEHGSWASKNTLKRIKQKQIYFSPTLKAAHCIINHKDCLPYYMVRNASDVLSETKKLIPKILDEKVTLVLGTDSGTPYNFHGENIKELEYMIDYGIPERLVFQSATENAAKLLGLEHKLGKIKEGFFADLILSKNHPLNEMKSFIKEKKIIISKGSLVK